MAEVKKLKICKRCSGLEVEDIKGRLKTKEYTTGCINRCAGSESALEGKVFGFIKGEFTVCDTKEAFLAKVDAIAAE